MRSGCVFFELSFFSFLIDVCTTVIHVVYFHIVCWILAGRLISLRDRELVSSCFHVWRTTVFSGGLGVRGAHLDWS